MSRIHVTHATAASPEICWALMADFANIDFFNPHLSGSRLLEGSPESGLGTLRQCDLKDGKGYIREKVVDWQEGRSYTVDIYDGTMPVDNTVTTLGLVPQAGGGTLLYMETSYDPRWGYVGALLDRLMIRRMFATMLLGVIGGLAAKAERRSPAPQNRAA